MTRLHPELLAGYTAAREQMARDIARAEGFEIIDADVDWTTFALDDAQTVTEGPMKGRTIRTCFDWNEFRFEGHVTVIG